MDSSKKIILKDRLAEAKRKLVASQHLLPSKKRPSFQSHIRPRITLPICKIAAATLKPNRRMRCHPNLPMLLLKEGSLHVTSFGSFQGDANLDCTGTRDAEPATTTIDANSDTSGGIFLPRGCFGNLIQFWNIYQWDLRRQLCGQASKTQSG